MPETPTRLQMMRADELRLRTMLAEAHDLMRTATTGETKGDMERIVEILAHRVHRLKFLIAIDASAAGNEVGR